MPRTRDGTRLDNDPQLLHLAPQKSQDQSVVDGVRCPNPTIYGHLTTVARVIKAEVPLRQLDTTSVQALQDLPPRERTVPQVLQPGCVQHFAVTLDDCLQWYGGCADLIGEIRPACRLSRPASHHVIGVCRCLAGLQPEEVAFQVGIVACRGNPSVGPELEDTAESAGIGGRIAAVLNSRGRRRMGRHEVGVRERRCRSGAICVPCADVIVDVEPSQALQRIDNKGSKQNE